MVTTPVRTASTVGIPIVAVISISVVAVAIKAMPVAAIVPPSVIAVIPRASADKYTAYKVAGGVIAVGRASIRVIGIVSVRTDGSGSIIGIPVFVIVGVAGAIVGVPIIGVPVFSVAVVVVVVVVIGVAVVVVAVAVVVVQVAIIATHANSDRTLRRRTRRAQGQNC